MYLCSSYCVTPRSWNTYLDTYSDFLSYLFDLILYLFYFMIIGVIILYWIWIRGLGVSPSLNRGGLSVPDQSCAAEAWISGGLSGPSFF